MIITELNNLYLSLWSLRNNGNVMRFGRVFYTSISY